MATATYFRAGSGRSVSDHVRRLRGRLTYFAAYLMTCLDVARQRRRLRAMDQRALKDIGISRIDACREARRGFWDIPEDQKPPV